jgi:hypothetical protein
MLSHPSGQQPGQRGQHRPIRPTQIRFADLAAQDRYLVTQNEQLRGLRRVRSREPRQPSKDLDHRQVQHPNPHNQIIARVNELAAHTPCDGFWHGTATLLPIVHGEIQACCASACRRTVRARYGDKEIHWLDAPAHRPNKATRVRYVDRSRSL